MHTSKKTTSAILSGQSAYRAGHSTETALIRVVVDLINAMDEDKISVLLLLDLSAAFDTIDHQILLSRLETVFGTGAEALGPPPPKSLAKGSGLGSASGGVSTSIGSSSRPSSSAEGTTPL